MIIFNVFSTRSRLLTSGLVTVGDSLCRTSTPNLKRREPKRAPGSLKENGTPINVFVINDNRVGGENITHSRVSMSLVLSSQSSSNQSLESRKIVITYYKPQGSEDQSVLAFHSSR